MVFIYILPLVAVISVVIIYLSVFSRPQPFPDGIRGVIRHISTVRFDTLEAEITRQRSREEDEEMLQLPKMQQHCIQRRRLQWLAHQVLAMQCNIKLFRAAAVWEVAQANDKRDLQRVSALILQTAPRCLLTLTVLAWQIKIAKGTTYLRPYSQLLNRPLVAMMDFTAGSYAHLTDYALTVAKSYGGVHYENLLSAL